MPWLARDDYFLAGNIVQAMYRTGRKINYVGKIVRVKSCSGGYKLPDGLPEKAAVEIIGFDIGSFDVVYRNQVFNISMACAEIGTTMERDAGPA